VQARDVIVVGGGPAGLATALHVRAAAPAARLLVLEAERYPREKICAGGIGARGLRVLEQLGISLDVPMVRLDAVALRVGGETMLARDPELGVVVRRIDFDHALANQVMARGIEVRDGCAVRALRVTDSGVEVEVATGETLHARAIVGADGVAGIVRRAAGFPRGELRAQVVELDTEAAPRDLPRDTIVFDFTAADLSGYAWDFPTLVAGEPLVCRGAYVLHHRGPDSPRARVERYLAACGAPRVRSRYKQFAERGFEPGAAISRPRVLLVGEAAGIDIATGEGIAQAIEYGALAGPYLARALARDDLGFASWRRHVDLHHVGWQLRIRHACYRVFFSRRRPTVERMLPAMSALLRVGVQDFAGKRVSKLDLVRGAAQFLRAYVRENARD
jgi:flavin-dependent dehydrogenase